MEDDYKPRFTFEITEEQRLRANTLLSTYGQRKAIFGKILDDVLDLIESHHGLAVGIMMSENVVTAGVISVLEKGVKPNG